VPARQLRWAILILNFEPVQGHEQGGERRALVVSYEPFHLGGMLTVCPITAARAEPKYPQEVAIGRGEAGQTADAVILCHQVRTLSVLRAGRTIGGVVGYVMDPGIRSRVRHALATQLGLDIGGLADGASDSAEFS
jgi:mRNA-degrading endonuclease toxin of MazEF toxin-antitoxin module